ncbi:MAG: MAPEG family protein [Acidiphilium sp.]|nr:MAPEG family protein [Acidiphilium sp.]MDD4935965.1 MAPEG family protein [Acidiphilium sp.]
MTFPHITATYGAILALIYMVLSAWVVAGRGTFKVLHGDGGNLHLNRRIRAHANFAEYVPLILILVGLLEADGAGPVAMNALLLPLVIARIIHPFGMIAPENSAQQFALRAPGAMITWIVLVAAAVMLLLRLG